MAHLRQLSLAALSALAMLPACSESHGNDGDVGTDGGTIYIDTCVCDALLPDAPPTDAPPPDDGGVRTSCDPDDAHGMTCPMAICDGLDSYAWDGERCLRIDCGTCVGPDCGALPTSEAACLTLHADCVPQLCRATGGEWLFHAEECSHYHCGFPGPADCLVGRPVCNCGYGRSFGVEGCFDDSCPEVDPVPPETLCPATGGTWTDGICCSTHCGDFCELACAAPGCVCGEFQVFDAVRGCVDAAECYVRDDGETCTNVHTRCNDGSICCQNCGGPGCDPQHYCHPPVCDADPNIDECGNMLFAP